MQLVQMHPREKIGVCVRARDRVCVQQISTAPLNAYLICPLLKMLLHLWYKIMISRCVLCFA